MRRSSLLIAALLTALTLAALALAAVNPAKAWVISVRNDLNKSENDKIRVSHVRTADNAREFRLFYLWPHKTKQLSEKDVVSFRVERRIGRDLAQIWIVTLRGPQKDGMGKKITLDFTQIQENRLPEGFSIKRGRWTRAHGTQWLD